MKVNGTLMIKEKYSGDYELTFISKRGVEFSFIALYSDLSKADYYTKPIKVDVEAEINREPVVIKDTTWHNVEISGYVRPPDNGYYISRVHIESMGVFPVNMGTPVFNQDQDWYKVEMKMPGTAGPLWFVRLPFQKEEQI